MTAARDDRWLDGPDQPSLTELFFLPHGRLSRRAFWLYGVAVLLGLNLLGVVLLGIAGVRTETAEAWVNLLLVWPAVAVSIKRWHDRDKSGWWVLVALVPVVGWVWMLVDNGCIRGTAGPNRYGPDPLATAADRWF